MNKTTHILGGVVATTLIFKAATTPETIIFGAIGGLLPDIDHENSTLGKLNPLSSKMEHRGFCHSLVFVAIIGALCKFVLKIPIMNIESLQIGMLSHLLLDMLNIQGIQLLWPIKKEFSLPLHGIKTGGMGEMVIRLALLYICVMSLITMNLI